MQVATHACIMHVCVHVSQVHECAQHAFSSIHVHIHASVDASMLVLWHSCMFEHAWVHTCFHELKHVPTCAYTCTCGGMCACMAMHAAVYVQINPCVNVCVHTYIHECMFPAYIGTCSHALWEVTNFQWEHMIWKLCGCITTLCHVMNVTTYHYTVFQHA
jgi:hypothetical protein